MSGRESVEHLRVLAFLPDSRREVLTIRPSASVVTVRDGLSGGLCKVCDLQVGRVTFPSSPDLDRLGLPPDRCCYIAHEKPQEMSSDELEDAARRARAGVIDSFPWPVELLLRGKYKIDV